MKTKKPKNRKTKAEKEIKSEHIKESKKAERPLALTIAALLFGFFGAAYLVVSIAALVMPEVAAEVNRTFIAVLAAFGALSLVTAYGIWKMRLYGGIIGAVISGLNIASAIPSLMNPDMWLIVGIFIDALMLFLIALSWRNLK